MTPSLVSYPGGDGFGSMYPSGDGHGKAAMSSVTAADAYLPMPPWVGDGHLDEPGALPYAVFGPPGGQAALRMMPPAGAAVKPAARTPKNELWKLLTLVTLFVIWISAASTLLFLYMDRYLFPG